MDKADLIVELRSDGTIVTLNNKQVTVPEYCDLIGWSILHTIIKINRKSRSMRKGTSTEQINTIEYQFVNMKTGDRTIIDKEHIFIIDSLIK